MQAVDSSLSAALACSRDWSNCFNNKWQREMTLCVDRWGSLKYILSSSPYQMGLTLSSWLGLSYRSAQVSSVNAETTLSFCTSSNTQHINLSWVVALKRTTAVHTILKKKDCGNYLLAHFKYSSFWKKMAPVFHIIWWNSLSSTFPILCLPVWWSVMGVLQKQQLQN